jgi:hypothetical protein
LISKFYLLKNFPSLRSEYQLLFAFFMPSCYLTLIIHIVSEQQYFKEPIMTIGSCFIILLSIISAGLGADGSLNPYTQWDNGPPKTEDFFPIAVWLQNPRNAERYKQAGINT